jgi:hypothetical protein
MKISRLIALIIPLLLTLQLGGTAVATICMPGGLTFLEIDGNVGANSSVDWADSGANPSGCSPMGSNPINCSGTGGIFDGGAFVNATTPPTPPTFASSDPSIVAAAFGVDALSVDKSKHCSVAVTQRCFVNGDCPAGETCVECDGDPTVYTGMGGETNGDLISSETWGNSSVPNKDDISNVYAIARQVPTNPDTTSCTMCPNGAPSCSFKNEIYAGFERVVNNGDSHVDLEFLQSTVGLVPTVKDACQGSFAGHRTEGDLLLSVDFTTGGSIGTPVLHRWICGDCPKDPATKVCDPCKVSGKKVPAHYEALNGPDVLPQNQVGHCSDNPTKECTVSDVSMCTNPATATCNLIINAITQSVNGGGPVGCGGWACRNADGTGPLSTINTNQFYEVGIDLAGAGFNGCLSTFLPHTRSSQSFTATLKDFEVINFNTCVPSTKLTKTASKTSVVTGDSVTYTYTEMNDGNVPLTNVSVTDDKCSPVTLQSGDNGNSVLDPGETWTFTCSRNLTKADCATQSSMCTVTNTATGHASFTPPGTTIARDVTFCTDPNNPPANTFCDQDERATAMVTVLTPSTSMTKQASASVVTTVNYTYTETNDGKVNLTPPGGTANRASIVSDPDCTTHGGTIAYDSGDNGNGLLDAGETWTLKCTATYNGVGPFSDTAVGHGCFMNGAGVTKDVTIGTAQTACGMGSSVFTDADETATTSVNVCAP